MFQESLAKHHDGGSRRPLAEVWQLQMFLHFQTGIQESSGWASLQTYFSKSAIDYEICLGLHCEASGLGSPSQTVVHQGAEHFVSLSTSRWIDTTREMGQECGFDEESACLWTWWWLISNYPLHVLVRYGILTLWLLRSRHLCLGRWSVVDSTLCASKVGFHSHKYWSDWWMINPAIGIYTLIIRIPNIGWMVMGDHRPYTMFWP